MRVCEKCQETIDESSVFCSFCGMAQTTLEQPLSDNVLDSKENFNDTKTIWSNKVVRFVTISSLLLMLVGYGVYKFPLLQENITVYINNQSDKSKKILNAHSQIRNSLISFGDLRPGVLGTHGNPLIADVVGELLLDEDSEFSKISGNIFFSFLNKDMKKCVDRIHENNVEDLKTLLKFTQIGYIEVKVLLSSLDDLSRHSKEGYECAIVLGEYNNKSAKTDTLEPAPVAAIAPIAPPVAPATDDPYSLGFKRHEVTCPSTYTRLALNKVYMNAIGTGFAPPGKDSFKEKKQPRWMMNAYLTDQMVSFGWMNPTGKAKAADVEYFKEMNSRVWVGCVSIDGTIYAVYTAFQPHNAQREAIALTSLPSEVFLYSRDPDMDLSLTEGDAKKAWKILEIIGYLGT